MPIYGTRPEAIKMAPIVHALKTSPDLNCIVTVTGQHRAMLDQVNTLFGITPDFDLNILRQGQTLNSILTRTVKRLDKLLSSEVPDAVIVQGDTTTSTASAIAAFNRGIPVIHVEAGLRSGNMYSPFPEEGNRKITSQIASLHLAPTAESKNNLLAANIPLSDIVITGNTVIDALLSTAKKTIAFSDSRLDHAIGSGKKLLLMTTHRRENQGVAMQGVARAITQITEMHPDVLAVIPAHKNPIVRDALLPQIQDNPNIIITEPLTYGEFTKLLAHSHIVLTDSGGVQEEAPSLRIPVLVMRDTTERPEAVAQGVVSLVGTSEENIVAGVSRLLHDKEHYKTMARGSNPYGDGLAAARTVQAIRSFLGLNPDRAHISEFQDSNDKTLKKSK